MTAHIKVNADAATLDRAVLHDLLRTELGFEGAIVADALEMKGVSARHERRRRRRARGRGGR